MSPRDLDAGIVLARLTSIRELLHDLRLAGEVSKADLQRDRRLRHAVERILTQLVELAVSVNSHVAATALGKAPGDYRESFELLQAATSCRPNSPSVCGNRSGYVTCSRMSTRRWTSTWLREPSSLRSAITAGTSST